MKTYSTYQRRIAEIVPDVDPTQHAGPLSGRLLYRGQPLAGTGLFGPSNAALSLQMFWFALMPWKLFVFRVASDGPFDTGWLPASPGGGRHP